MKVTPQHLAALEAAITPRDTAELRAAYRAGDFPRSEGCNVDMRYRWDLLWMARTADYDNRPRKLDPVFDAGYNDAHLDTALRNIVPDVTRFPNPPVKLLA